MAKLTLYNNKEPDKIAVVRPDPELVSIPNAYIADAQILVAPQVQEKIVYQIVEKPVEKIVYQVVEKPITVEKEVVVYRCNKLCNPEPVEKIVYQDRIIETPASVITHTKSYPYTPRWIKLALIMQSLIILALTL